MSKYLEKHVVKKGTSAEKLLNKLSWNKKWHQKLINRGYNKAFKAVAKDPKTPVPANTVLLVPVVDPETYEGLKKKLKKNAEQLAALADDRVWTQEELSDLISHGSNKEQKILKKIEDAQKKFDTYFKHREAVYLDCIEGRKDCEKVAKYAIPMAEKRMKKVQGELRKLKKAAAAAEKTVGLSKAEMKTLDGILKELRELEKEEQKTVKNVLSGLKDVISLAIIMP